MQIKSNKGTFQSNQHTIHHLHLNKTQLILSNCQRYNHSHLNLILRINKITKKPKSLFLQILTNEPSEWLQKRFLKQQSQKQLLQLIQYYKYYKMYPTLVNTGHFSFMHNYWIKVKTLYYRKIKKILQIEEVGGCDQSIQRNVTNSQSHLSGNPFKTFYLKEHMFSSLNGTHQENRTIEKILHFMIKKQNSSMKSVNKECQKNSKLTKEKSSIDKNRLKFSNQALSHLKSTPSQVVSQFSQKTNVFQKKKKLNTKSYSNQNLFQSQKKKSKGKKLMTTSSCANINLVVENQLNYKRRDKNQKKVEKTQKNVKKQKSKTKQNQVKVNHRRKSNEKSMQITRKSQSNSKTNLFLQTNVKAAINKTKNKIKMQKNQILKKIIDSRQSYIKSIDSTCGQVGLKNHKK